jgi:CheY-like chemotaxis protein
MLQHSAAVSNPGAGRRVLMAEDNAVNRRVARHHLERAGFAVEFVNDGQSAVDTCQNGQFDLILMDVQMPVCDGLEATRRIRAAENGGRRVPIIAMTAHAMVGDRKRCLDAGMDDYVAKPIQAAELMAAVQRWLPAKPAPSA